MECHQTYLEETLKLANKIAARAPVALRLAKEAINKTYFKESSTSTTCPWKGQAAYWSVSAGAETLDNGAWAYPDPLPELAAISGYLSFYEAVTIEG